jgi:hypothetical protein
MRQDYGEVFIINAHIGPRFGERVKAMILDYFRSFYIQAVQEPVEPVVFIIIFFGRPVSDAVYDSRIKGCSNGNTIAKTCSLTGREAAYVILS